MVYTTEEKRKMDSVLAAFAAYTAAHTEFDVAYSDKTGYVRLIIAEHADQVFFPVASFKELLEMFAMELISEEVERQYKSGEPLDAMTVDYASAHRRLQEYIDKMEEDLQTQALDVVNRYITSCVTTPLFP